MSTTIPPVETTPHPSDGLSWSTTDHGLQAMLFLSDADFLRGLKTNGQDYLLIVRKMNERIESIAQRLEKR